MRIPPNHSAFTVRYNGRANVIVTDIAISKPFQHSEHEVINAIWDTGATGTVITASAAKKLGLSPIGFTKSTGIHGTQEVPVYLIDVILRNKVIIQGVKVTECQQLTSNTPVVLQALIGMDIIGVGDFALSQQNGSTTFSFRVPSVVETDYVAEHRKANQPQGNRFTPSQKDKRKNRKR